MHEIITVQLGQQSNYLATHFWNTQVGYKMLCLILVPISNFKSGIILHLFSG